MKTPKIIIPILMLLILFGSCFQSIGQDVVTEDHVINIESYDDHLKVEESITLIGSGSNNYSEMSFWMMDDSSDIEIFVNNNKIDEPKVNKNIYTVNISNLNINMNTSLSIVLTYNLETSVRDTGFEKTLVRDTNKITVKYDNTKLYSADDITEGNKFTLKLVKYEEETLSVLSIVAVFLLILLLIVFTAYFFKKQRMNKEKQVSSNSEEYLTTKKSLLMQLLKDIEKRHRTKKISDDTYHKLKDHYKSEAVETMKKMEEIKSEIK